MSKTAAIHSLSINVELDSSTRTTDMRQITKLGET